MTNEHPLDVFDELLDELGRDPASVAASDDDRRRWRDRMEAALEWFARIA